jgi:hypothetical protein
MERSIDYVLLNDLNLTNLDYSVNIEEIKFNNRKYFKQIMNDFYKIDYESLPEYEYLKIDCENYKLFDDIYDKENIKLNQSNNMHLNQVNNIKGNNSSPKNMSNKETISINSPNISKNNETKDKINDNNDFSNLSETNKGKKGFKKKYNYNNDENLKENANKYFKRIIDTAQELKNNEIRKDPLVDEILEKSQLLEPDDLKSLASKKRISVVGDNELSEFDLKKKDVRQLDGILADININSDVSKLKNEKRENIKRIKARKNLENQSILDYMHHKAIKEQKKLESSQNVLKEKSNSVNNNLEKEFDSCSDDESI